MSICPSKELFSAYIDDEIASPWKEQLTAHLQECYECQKQYHSYQKLHVIMQHHAFPIEKDFNQSFSTLITKQQKALQKKKEAKRNWVHASVKVPVPVCAAALLLLILMPALFLTKKGVNQAPVSTASFKPIVPVSLERQKKIRQANACVLCSTDMSYAFPKNKIVTEVMFTMRDFAMLYANRKELFSDLPNVYLTAAVSDTAAFHSRQLNSTTAAHNNVKAFLQYK